MKVLTKKRALEDGKNTTQDFDYKYAYKYKNIIIIIIVIIAHSRVEGGGVA